jgi:hypothetical protein
MVEAALETFYHSMYIKVFRKQKSYLSLLLSLRRLGMAIIPAIKPTASTIATMVELSRALMVNMGKRVSYKLALWICYFSYPLVGI